MRGSGHCPVSPAEFDGVVTSSIASRYTSDEPAAESAVAQGPARSPSDTSFTVTAAPAGALTATWNAQNSFLAHESSMLLWAGGGGSLGRSFCVSRTVLTVIAARAVDPTKHAKRLKVHAREPRTFIVKAYRKPHKSSPVSHRRVRHASTRSTIGD